ncbi:MAG TPA: dTDP-glucose 4,6-dehydratase [Verrucomicrobiales bacterium]|nr:dTDP-glucose 4,6-dehydratase [Verrucomicrobiales bacterium]HIL69683.1 dTDP-glucose 4,6-dehydratase [Verrucomicrobiota bacterium]
MNLLVTGGAGFIGSNLIRQLVHQDGIDVLCNLDSLSYAGHRANFQKVADHPKHRFFHVDLRDKEKVVEVVEQNRISHVMHLAAESHVDRSIAGPDDFIHSNVIGTFNLLEACRVYWAGDSLEHQFLQVSTDEVYGSLGPSGLFTESTPLAPNSPYSASKASGDLLGRAYFQTYQMPVVTTRCSNNYGPYQFPEKLIPVVIGKVLDRKPIPVYGDGGNIREWIHVDDHAKGLWDALIKGQPGECYNIGTSDEISNLDLVQRLCDLCDELFPDQCNDSRSLITFVKDRLGHDRRYALDSTKMRRELGWSSKWELSEGLKQTVKWYHDHADWMKTVTENG